MTPRIVHRTELDGLPVYWSDCPAVPFTAALVFRVGWSDETLPTRGITHFVEHLVAAALGTPDYDHNAYVDDTTTAFHATGTVEEVASFLSGVAAALNELPQAWMERERGILRAEEDQNEPGAAEAMRSHRFGYAGVGLAAVPQFGLEWLEFHHVRDWASERFTAQNAGLWFTGPPPRELRLPLPPGKPFRRIHAAPLPLTLPAFVRGPEGGIAMSMVGDRSVELNAASGIIERRLRQRLRHERGLVYHVDVGYGPVSGDLAEILITADTSVEHAAEVRDAFIGVVDDLADNGPTESELGQDRARLSRDLRDPLGCPSWAHTALYDDLVGEPVALPAELVALRDALTPEGVAAAVATAVRSALIHQPRDVPPPPERYAAYPGWSSDVVDGRAFRRAGIGRFVDRKERLIVGRDGVSVRFDTEQAWTVRYEDCVGMESAPDGCRVLWGRDLVRVLVIPGLWKDGTGAVAMIDAAVPASVQFPVARISMV